MKKLLRVFKYEYSRHVFRKRFIFALLGMPLILIVIAVFGFISIAIQYRDTPVGYVDKAGVIADESITLSSGWFFKPVELIRFADESAARLAVDQGTIQGAYIIDENYIDTGIVHLVAPKTVSSNAQDDFQDFLQLNLLATQPQDRANRLLAGPEIEVISIDGSRHASSQHILDIVIPIVVGILFMIMVNITGGYLLQALLEEKENRTMEIIITSISPNQLMIGKTLADMCVGLTQLAAWLGFGVLGLAVAKIFSPWVAGQQYNLGSLGLVIALIFPAFIMIAGLMSAVGAMVTESQEAQQMATIFTLPLFVPLWFVGPLMTNPNSPLVIGMSLFPLTSPMTMPLRAAFTTVPTWQLAISLAILYLCAAGALILAGRAFRIGMLQYGRRIKWREVFQRG
jgi:ABC-2 type transport system permease protein